MVLVLAGGLLILASCRDGEDRPPSSPAETKRDAFEAFGPEGIAIPSYDSHLETVIMHAVPDVRVQEPLIQALPEYTEIILLAPDYKEKNTREAVRDLALEKNRIKVLVYSGDLMWRGYWAQDMFEVLATDRAREIILPDFFTFEDYYKWRPLPFEPTQETDGFLSFLHKEGFRGRAVTGYFEGGNLNTDRHNGESLLIVGSDNFIDKEAFRDYNFLLDEGVSLSMQSVYLHGERLERAALEYREQFGADRVLLLGDSQYATHMFHLDQCFVEVGPAEVVLLDLAYLTEDEIDDVAGDFSSNFSYLRDRRDQLLKESRISFEESLFLEKFVILTEREEVRYILNKSKRMLEEIGEALGELGYRIHRLRQDPYQNLHYQSYANSVVFTDRESGIKKILMPIFPDIEGNYDAGGMLNRAAGEFFEGLGLEVIPVVNYTWASGGNINCLLNVYKQP